MVIILLYVDDIIITGSSTPVVQATIRDLTAKFSMTNLGPLHHFLGISVSRTSDGLFLSQCQYTQEILAKAHMTNCKPSSTLVDTKSKLNATAGDPVNDPTLYQSLVVALQYLTFTRPYISYAVQHICLFIHDPRVSHF